MGPKVLPSEARLTDARFIAAVDASFAGSDPNLRAERQKYWRQRIEQNPHTVFVAKAEGIRTVGYIALQKAPTGPDELISVHFAIIESECENVKEILLERAGVMILPIQESADTLLANQEVAANSL